MKNTSNETADGSSLGDYIVHPVFTNAPENGGWDKELAGIWVAKFEASSSETELVLDTGTYTTQKVKEGGNPISVVASGTGYISNTIKTFGRKNNSTEFVTVKPNVTSWRSITFPQIETKSRAVSGNHGIAVDSHMMKNTEWGAVAYLTQSRYGNTAVWNNPYNEGEIYLTSSNTYGMYNYCGTITGMVGETQNKYTNYYSEKIAKTYNADGSITIKYKNINESGEVTTEYTNTYYAYDTASGIKGSTTGNIYGIYDMSGGAWEYVAAYVNNGGTNYNNYKGTLRGKYVNIYEKGETDNGTATSTTEGIATLRQENYLANANRYPGDAVHETSTQSSGASSWNNDYSYFPFGAHPFFRRGGYFDVSSGAGVFAFYYGLGESNDYYSFRPVLVP